MKVTLFQGAQLKPQPAKTSKYPAVSYHYVCDPALPIGVGEDGLGDTLADWVRQASLLAGERL